MLVEDSSYGTLCWTMVDQDDACKDAMQAIPSAAEACAGAEPNEVEGPDPSVCRQVSNDVRCMVGRAIICEDANASGCETPEAIDARADATVEAICG